MEPMMISLKVLSTAAVIALVLPMTAPTASFAQSPGAGRGAASGGVRAGGGGGAPGAHFNGGGGGAPRAFSGGGGAAPAFSGGGGGFSRGGGGAAVAQNGANGGVWRGGGGEGWRGRGGGDWHGGYGEHHHRDRDGGFIPGAVAGAVIGGAIASQSYGYYGGTGYYAPGYYDDQYYDDGAAVAVAPAPVGDDGVAYCMQTYQSYDPASGTYLGYDGYRHLCP
jgi:hypothetical protein